MTTHKLTSDYVVFDAQQGHALVGVDSAGCEWTITVSPALIEQLHADLVRRQSVLGAPAGETWEDEHVRYRAIFAAVRPVAG